MAGLRLQTKRRQSVETGRPSSNGSEEIARVAYELYEHRGRTDGHDLDDWLQAEAIVRRRRSNR